MEFVEGDGVFEVDSEANYGGGAADLVVAGVGDVLVVGCDGDAPPEVGRVVGLEDLFVAVV